MLIKLLETRRSAGREFKRGAVISVAKSHGERLIASGDAEAAGPSRSVTRKGGIIGRAESEAQAADRRARRPPKAPNTMQPEELKEELTARGVPFTARTRRADLVAMVTEARAKAEVGAVDEAPQGAKAETTDPKKRP